jgi:peptidoglycan/xylan/chitin deacetylase (PgdA/CDA1 family)
MLIMIIVVSNIANIALSKSISAVHHKKSSGSAPVSKSSRHSSSHQSFTNSPASASINHLLVSKTATSNSTDKIVMLTFGDTKKSQFTVAKSILDQYGFKASFFITCSYANDRDPRYHLNWNQILALQQDGQDIESKGMTPIDLNNISSSALAYQIGGSKQCLENHGIKSPNWFAAKYGDVWNNATVINAISKYYQFADDGSANLMFLHCDGYPNSKQTDCRTYDDQGKLNYANAYSVREWNHNALDRGYQHNDQLIFQRFVQEVNSGIGFNNKKGIVDAIPVIAYHIVDNTLNPSSTDINLFAAEMKYLYDKGFNVIPMSDLGYNQTTNLMYIK